MSNKTLFSPEIPLAHLHTLGGEIRARRKMLGVNATTTAESAGISRVTLHRIEKGEPSVTMGAYMNVMAALGLSLPGQGITEDTEKQDVIPTRIKLDDYPQLRQLAWQVHGTELLTPLETRDIYERNWRHLDQSQLEDKERQLINALQTGLGGDFPRV